MGLALVACAGCSRGDDREVDEVVAARSSQVRSAARKAGLPAEVADVVATAAGAPAATFSAVFVSEGVEGSVVVQQRPPRRRVDVVDGSGRTVSSFVVEGATKATRCERAAGADRWRCVDADDETAGASVGAFDPAALDATIEALAEAADPVTVERTTVAGVDARCVRSGPSDRFCISADGVPLLVERADGSPTVRATTYRSSVRDGELGRPDQRLR